MFRKLALLAIPLAVSTAPAQSLVDPSLVIESVTTTGTFQKPTSMVFLGPDDILVSRQTGTVHRVLNGTVQTSPVLSLSLNGTGEMGLLGMALDPEFHEPGHNFVYLSTATSRIRIRRYEWDESQLSSETILLDIPSFGLQHFGGIIAFGPPSAAPADQKLFFIRGDGLNNTKSENYENGRDPEGTAMVIRINKDGSTPTGADRGPFYDVANGNVHLERMYAFGIRNSFGMAFDPVSSALWDTENGPEAWDEINRIDPGFNSGWYDVMGPSVDNPFPVGMANPGSMTTFGNPPVGTYSEPEFSFSRITVPTAILFLDTEKLGPHNQNDCIVSARDGLYRFELNETRTDFLLDGDLADKRLDTLTNPPTAQGEETPIRFAYNLGAPVDLEIGPDGYLYVLSYFHQKIYRIKPASAGISDWHVFE